MQSPNDIVAPFPAVGYLCYQFELAAGLLEPVAFHNVQRAVALHDVAGGHPPGAVDFEVFVFDFGCENRGTDGNNPYGQP